MLKGSHPVPSKPCEGHSFSAAERLSLRRLAYSPNVADKRRCVDYLDAAACQNRLLIFELADVLIPSRSARVRWGTLINLGGFSETHPAELWPLVVRWGTVPSEDIRVGVACCILEHILEAHFTEYFERSKKAVQDNGRFGLTLRMCARFGQAKEPTNATAFDAFVSSLATPRRRRVRTD